MRHRFHALCPYFAMFPEDFVRKQLVWTRPGDIVFDPFSGRGTTVFESLLNGREAIGCDINPVAVCVSNAKANPPAHSTVVERIAEIEAMGPRHDRHLMDNEFFATCFHAETFGQILRLRHELDWRRNRTDRFIAALVLGSLHGESHRSKRYFSNRMPRTISTKPAYSIRWWKKRRLSAPKRDAFSILKEMADYRFVSPVASHRGTVRQIDARRSINAFPKYERRVSLVVTSPPYLDTTDFEEDQWLRLWFLGGPARPIGETHKDHRHVSADKYWEFLTETWAGVEPLLKKKAHIVVRIGGKKMDVSEIEDELTDSLEDGLGRKVTLVEAVTTKIEGGQIRAFRPGVEGVSSEHDFHFLVGR